MSVIVKNKSGGQKVYGGVVIEDDAQYTVQGVERHLFANDETLLADIGSVDAVINDGIDDLSIGDGIDLLRNYSRPTPITPVQKIPKVSVYRPEGSSATIVSHDWTDPCTWYNKSSRVTGETLTLDTGNIYDFANTNVIDLTHGRLSDENNFTGYELKVYDNAVEKTEDTDYTMDYENGKVTFNSAPTGPVTADYSYANGSEWVLKPSAGKVIHIEHAELNFSKDISMSAVAFEIWVYNPFDLPNKVKYQEIVYKNIKDIINSANLGQGYIPAIGGLTQDVLVFPFNYATVKSLKDSDGAELRVRILSDVPYTGEFSTATFYILSEDL